jgi:hypothetical protein
VLQLLALFVAIALAAAALARAYVPPQSRKVHELEGRIQDLEFAYDELAKRMTRRARTEGLETAREVHKARSERSDRATEEALRIIDEHKAPGAAAAALPSVPNKIALRARLIAGGKL